MNRDLADHPVHSLRPRSLSLRLKMLIGFGLLFSTALVLVVMTMTFGIPFTAYTGSYGHDRGQVLKNLRLVADLKRERLVLWLDERKDDAKKISEAMVTVGPSIEWVRETLQKNVEKGKRGEELRAALLDGRRAQILVRHLDLTAGSYKAFQKMQIVDGHTGFVLASTNDTEVGEQVPKKQLLTRMPDGSDETSVDIEKVSPDGKTYLIMSHIVGIPSSSNDNPDSQRAVVLLYFDTDHFLKPLVYTGKGLGGKTGEVVLVNQDARILMSLKYPLPDGTIPKVLEYQIKTESVLPAIQGKDGIVVGEDYRGVPVLTAYRHIKVNRNVSWGMVVKCDQFEVFAPLRQSIFYSSFIGVLALIAAGLLAILVAKRISRPIENLTRTAQAVSDGNLAVRAEVIGSDDVGTLATTFNSMLGRIQNWRGELEKQVKERTARLNELNMELTGEVARRTRAEESLKKTNRRLLTLSDCNQAVVRAAEESSLLHEICRIIVEVGGYPIAWVGFAEDDELKTVRPVARWGFEERDFDKLNVSWADDEKGRGPMGTAIRTKKLCILRNAVSDPVTSHWREKLKRYGIGSLVSFPLRIEGEVIGATTIAAEEVDAFDEEEVKLLGELTGDLAYGIEMLRTRAARREAEALVVRANKEWERTFNSISDLIMVLDSQYKILRANKAMADALGMTQQEVIGKSCLNLVRGQGEPPDFCPHAQLLADGKEHSAEVAEPRLGGVFDIRVSPVIGQDGRIIGSVHITRDITARKQSEEALSQSESMLRSVLEAAPVGIGVVVSRVFKWTNNLTVKMTGYSQEELLGQSARMLYENDEEFERVGAVKYTQIAATGTGTTDTRWKRKDGTLIDIILSSTAIDPQNMATGVIFTAMDVSARKQAEEALKDSEERYRAVFDNAGIGIDVVDREGNLAQANPALLNMLGYTHADLSQLTLMDIVHPDGRKTSRQYFDAMVAGRLDSCKFEKCYIKKDGSTVWGDLSVSTIRDPGGNVRTMVGVIADITERRESQSALQISERRMRRIIDSSPIGIRITQDGRYVYANSAIAAMFGYERPEELLGLPVEALFAPESKALIRQRVADRMAGKTVPRHYEASGMTRHGRTFGIESWGTEIDYLGKTSWLVFIIDVSEAKSLRSQLLQAQKMEAIGNLAGGVAHDFNNLLTVIQGFSELLLLDESIGDHAKSDLEKVNHAAQSGADLVRRLLMFSRKSEIKARPTNLNHQISQTESLLSRTIPKTINIELHLAHELPAVNADPTQIDQVLMNLAVNAKDAMPDGGKLVIKTQSVILDEEYSRSCFGFNPGNYVLLMLSDTGEGIDKESLGHIFEPFFTTKSPGKGTGLGLAVVYGIVKQHGGHITCDSEPGVGTTFKIYLPFVETQIPPRTQTDSLKIPDGTETILLVDDEQDVKDLGERILTRAGYTVLTAANGREALDVFKKEKETISLVILDLIMPEMDGHQCLKEILRIEQQARVIVSSGYCPRRGMGEKPSPLGEDFSGPAGPETWLPRSGSKAPHSPITAVGEKGIFLGGCESRIHPDKRKCRRSHRL